MIRQTYSIRQHPQQFKQMFKESFPEAFENLKPAAYEDFAAYNAVIEKTTGDDGFVATAVYFQITLIENPLDAISFMLYYSLHAAVIAIEAEDILSIDFSDATSPLVSVDDYIASEAEGLSSIRHMMRENRDTDWYGKL